MRRREFQIKLYQNQLHVQIRLKPQLCQDNDYITRALHRQCIVLTLSVRLGGRCLKNSRSFLKTVATTVTAKKKKKKMPTDSCTHKLRPRSPAC